MRYDFNIPFIDPDTDLWEYRATPWGLAPPLTRKRPKKRIRKMTLASAIAAAKKAGASAVTVGDVTVAFGEQHSATKLNGHTIESADELKALI